MKKLIATLMLSVLALVPATSAWASDGGRSSSEQSARAAASAPRALSTAKEPTACTDSARLFAVGCRDGCHFAVYIDEHGHFTGGYDGESCDYGNIIVLV